MTGVQGMKSHQNRKPQGEAESGAAERGSNVEQGEPCGDLRNCWNRVKENHLAEVLGQEEQCMGKELQRSLSIRADVRRKKKRVKKE